MAFANRMSPAGIPLFYRAFDADTAVREAWAGPGRELVSVGRFTNTAPLSVINLASLPAIPSIFDEARRHLRPPLRFFYEFSNRISAPVRTAARSEAEIVFVGREHCVDEDRGDGRPVLALESAAVRDQLPASALAL